MSAELIIQLVLASLQTLPTLLGDAAAVSAWISQTEAVLKGGDPTPAQWAALNAALLAQITDLQAAAAQKDPPALAPVVDTPLAPAGPEVDPLS